MADTKEIIINDRDWTEIAVGQEKGFITCQGKNNGILREASAQPSVDSTFGHIINNDDDDGYSYDVPAGQSIFARATTGNTKLIVTPIG